MITSEKEFFNCFRELMFKHYKSTDHNKFVVLGKGEGKMLAYIGHCEHEVTPGEIQEKMGVGSGRVANALKDLEKKGYILRKQSEEDKRKTIVTITQKGIDLNKSNEDEVKLRIEKIYNKLGPEDADTFIRLMTKIIE